MKKVSAYLFFTVLWRGLCQALGWFFGLFGYKREGWFGKCVWGMFATSVAIVMSIIALVLVCAFGEEGYKRYVRGHHCEVVDCCHSQYVGRNIYFHNTGDGKGYIYNSLTGEKTLRHVAWISKPLGKDSLVCFSNGKKRGYFSKHTGKVVIEPKYNHAWVFSEGLASVEEDGFINFIDTKGNVAIDVKLPFFKGMDGYVFHCGYCVVYGDGVDVFGLMDRSGRLVLPCEYSFIIKANDQDMWIVEKGDQKGIVDKELNYVVPMTACSLWVSNGMIDMTMPDHTMRKLDLKGNLVNDFCISQVRMLEYEKDEIVYREEKINKVDDEFTEILEESYHPKATARLRAYVAGDGYEGLINACGHIVTMPIYMDIQALGPDLYICEISSGDKVIVNGKGDIVKSMIR